MRTGKKTNMFLLLKFLVGWDSKMGRKMTRKRICWTYGTGQIRFLPHQSISMSSNPHGFLPGMIKLKVQQQVKREEGQRGPMSM